MIKVRTKEQLQNIIQERIKKDGYQCNLNDLDVSNITNMSHLFHASKFNGYIDKWDTLKVVSMTYMFNFSEFNQDISKWDTSNVYNMKFMFSGSPFNKPLNKWDVSNVECMYSMFNCSSFNQDISNWDTKNVKNMSNMFSYSPFNQNISKWDVSNVECMGNMFYKNKSNLSEIKKSICKWKFNPGVDLEDFMDNPRINSLNDIKNMCKREQILENIGSFKDLLDI